MTMADAANIAPVELDFSKLNGLVPVVLQHAGTKEVLMVGFVNREAWEQTLHTGRVTLYRRTLGRVQVKGEETGDFLAVRRAVADCDHDSVVLEVVPDSPVCHYGRHSCFFREIPLRPDAQPIP